MRSTEFHVLLNIFYYSLQGENFWFAALNC